jgi:signal transduction histidine kinase
MQWGVVRQTFADVAVVAVAAGSGVLREVDDPNVATKLVAAPTWVYVVLQLAAALLLVARRRHPEVAALLIAGAAVFAPSAAVFLIPYAVTRWGSHTVRSWAVLAALVAAWLVGARAWAIDDPFSGPALIAVSAVLGLYVRARRRLVDELVQRAERAEREGDLLAERARVEERMRLAAEMHDVVTHRINLMVLQAGALQVTSAEPGVQRASGELRETGVQALAELRDLLGVLRSGPSPGALSREGPSLGTAAPSGRPPAGLSPAEPRAEQPVAPIGPAAAPIGPAAAPGGAAAASKGPAAMPGGAAASKGPAAMPGGAAAASKGPAAMPGGAAGANGGAAVIGGPAVGAGPASAIGGPAVRAGGSALGRGGSTVATGGPAIVDGPEVAALIGQSRAVGVAVEFQESGDPGSAAPAVRRALYRVVQESLTNVHKHAPGCAVRVEIRYATDGVAVEVHNTAPTRRADAALAGAGAGVGLAGLRRRVELLGGLLHATGRDDGGFTVTARLPSS